MRMCRLAGGRVSADPEEDELVGVSLQFVDGDDKAEIVQKEELKLQLIELVQRESSNL